MVLFKNDKGKKLSVIKEVAIVSNDGTMSEGIFYNDGKEKVMRKVDFFLLLQKMNYSIVDIVQSHLDGTTIRVNPDYSLEVNDTTVVGKPVNERKKSIVTYSILSKELPNGEYILTTSMPYGTYKVIGKYAKINGVVYLTVDTEFLNISKLVIVPIMKDGHIVAINLDKYKMNILTGRVYEDENKSLFIITDIKDDYVMYTEFPSTRHTVIKAKKKDRFRDEFKYSYKYDLKNLKGIS